MKMDVTNGGSELIHPRLERIYDNLSDTFTLAKRSFDRQFNSIYAARISQSRPVLSKAVENKWAMPTHALSSLNKLKNEKCVIVGTLFKIQPLKPSILQQVSKEYQTVPLPSVTHFVSEKDEIVLEDETQRVALTGKIDIHNLVTGCVVAVLGRLNNKGVFEVEDLCWPIIEPFSNLPEQNDEKYLVLIGGIDLATNKNSLTLQLFIDWVTGWNKTNDNFVNNSKIVHMILTGNCIRSSPQKKPKYGAIVDNSEDVEAVKELDYVMEQLITSIDVDIMPGEFDPTTHTLPQQQFHHSMFPKSSRFETFNPVTNPYKCRVENRIVLGTSGQPIEDIKRYSNLTDSIDILERQLKWAHIAPTAPDTLACYPFEGLDPFIISHRPHIFFAGNQPTFQTKLIPGNDYDTRLICIPSFSASQSFVLVNLKNLECKVVSLNVSI